MSHLKTRRTEAEWESWRWTATLILREYFGNEVLSSEKTASLSWGHEEGYGMCVFLITDCNTGGLQERPTTVWQLNQQMAHSQIQRQQLQQECGGALLQTMIIFWNIK